ncbi:uncharacterized protein LOC129891494 [Solanum dulcamara]|uniref:uncharacterized protein LOC129891494 n=1 Tax=Solanum dulcamara TaxID=45834 RepID=UPI002486CA98|nr:uncharacterized protein LOC129891494 [Solanum dulcamara]
MKQPLDFVAQGKYGKVWHLKKSLNGLKQSPRACFGKFLEVVQDFGLKNEKMGSLNPLPTISSRHYPPCLYIDDIVITQSDYAGISSLKSFSIPTYTNWKLAAKHCNTLMVLNAHLMKDKGNPFDDPERCRRLVGKIKPHLTRPNIAFTVTVVSQFMYEPTVKHWTTLKQSYVP